MNALLAASIACSTASNWAAGSAGICGHVVVKVSAVSRATSIGSKGARSRRLAEKRTYTDDPVVMSGQGRGRVLGPAPAQEEVQACSLSQKHWTTAARRKAKGTTHDVRFLVPVGCFCSVLGDVGVSDLKNNGGSRDYALAILMTSARRERPHRSLGHMGRRSASSTGTGCVTAVAVTPRDRSPRPG